VIDLHCHILPGLDDGPANLDFSVAMARAAMADGTQIMVATPHMRKDFDVDPAEIRPAVEQLNERLEAAGIMVRVMSGAEVGYREVADLDTATLEKLCLGNGDYVLVETPYGSRPVDIEGILGRVAERGFKTVLAHPERCPLFQKDVDRLAALVDDGVLVSITAGSLGGDFGDRPRRVAIEMLSRGIVHNIASDAHDHVHRPPGIAAALKGTEEELPGLKDALTWFTVTSPVAILRGSRPRAVPDLRRAPAGRWKRVFGSRRHAGHA
jgi:protein-tyrosine phosphatase